VTINVNKICQTGHLLLYLRLFSILRSAIRVSPTINLITPHRDKVDLCPERQASAQDRCGAVEFVISAAINASVIFESLANVASQPTADVLIVALFLLRWWAELHGA
jgi:hypothetical protein